MKLTRMYLSAFLALSLIGASALANDEGFKKRHPRRAEVNGRMKNQQKRIGEGIENGKINPGEAQKLEGEEKAIKQEERADVKANGGYLTKKEQRKLNKEENGVSKEIYEDKHN